jgi:transketolase
VTDPAALRELAAQLRVDSIRASTAATSGHPTSSMSAADLLAVLLADHLRYDFDDPANPANDHLIFSKGHASPLLYAVYKAAGAITEEDLLSFRRFGSRFEGHPTPILPWVDVATGSLGQGLPIAVGVALAGKRLDQLPYRTWVLCGDSEMAEGSMWEAFEHAAHAGLDRLTAIIDVNRLGQRGETMHGWDLDSYADRARAFGWHAIEVDGHDVEAIGRAYAEAEATTGRPTAVVARTMKGRGVKSVEDQLNQHGKPVADADEAIEELGGIRAGTVAVAKPEGGGTPHEFATDGALALPRYEVGDEVATRKAYGEALVALGRADGRVVALDGEVGNSTYAEFFTEALPERYFEMYIAEQQMVAAGVGMQVRGWTPFASSFAAFLSRAYDFVRMAAVSRARLCLSGSHAGVSIGEDGPSQMGLEDVASLRAVHGSNATAQLLPAMAAHDGIAYLRTLRGATPVLYGADEGFPVGGSKVPRSSDADVATVVAMGITVHEALKAADALAAEGIAVRVLDAYSVKPLDTAAVVGAAATGAVVTVEDHWPEGGLGEVVAATLADAGVAVPLTRLAVSGMPTSGKPGELLAAAGIDAAAIAEAVRGLVATPSSEERSA